MNAVSSIYNFTFTKLKRKLHLYIDIRNNSVKVKSNYRACCDTWYPKCHYYCIMYMVDSSRNLSPSTRKNVVHSKSVILFRELSGLLS